MSLTREQRRRLSDVFWASWIIQLLWGEWQGLKYKDRELMFTSKLQKVSGVYPQRKYGWFGRGAIFGFGAWLTFHSMRFFENAAREVLDLPADPS